MADVFFSRGSDWTFEFSPRNLATNNSGNLVLLDVLFSMELVERQREAARRKAQQSRRW